MIVSAVLVAGLAIGLYACWLANSTAEALKHPLEGPDIRPPDPRTHVADQIDALRERVAGDVEEGGRST